MYAIRSYYEQILDEAEASRKQLIEKSNDESLNVAYDKIKEEMKKISAKYVKIVSKTELDSKRRILQFREKLSNEVVENVKIKLSDFANSNLYKQYLIDSLKGILATESDNTEIVVLLSKLESSLKPVNLNSSLVALSKEPVNLNSFSLFESLLSNAPVNANSSDDSSLELSSIFDEVKNDVFSPNNSSILPSLNFAIIFLRVSA